MVNMKKILGILLALCFVVSVTAAAASANQNNGPKFDNHNNGPKFDNHNNGPKFDNHKPKFDNHKPKFDNHNKRHHHPAHWENKRVGHRVFVQSCGCYKTVYVIQKVFIKEYWGFN